MENRDASSKVNTLEARVAALTDRLALREKTVSDQSARFERTLLELQSAKSRWHDTFDAIDDMVAIVDKDYRIIAANRAMCKAFAGKEVVGAHCYELVHGADTPLPACPAQETFSTGQPARAEFCEAHLGGRWLNVHCAPMAGRDGAVEQVVLLVREVTERKKADEALLESEARFREMAASVREVFWMSTPDVSEMLYVSPSFEKIWGRSLQSVMKNPMEWVEAIHPADRDRVLGALAEHAQGRYDLEYRIVQPDGTVRWIHDRGSPVCGDAGQVLRMVGLAEDITERKGAEEALAKSEERLKAIFENAADGLLVVDLERKKICNCNPMICQMLGYSPAEMVLLGIPDIHPEKDLPYVLDQFERQRRREFALAKDLPMKRKDGTVFYADVSGVPMTLGGRECVVGFFRDSTDRRQAQEGLKRYAEDLERANEEVKQFAYIVSHDLRAPLVNLKGFAAEIRSSLEVLDSAIAAALPHLSEEQGKAAIAAVKTDIPEAVHFIDSSAARMDSLIGALLKLSRLGRQELQYEPLDVADIVQTALKGLTYQMEERRVNVTVGPLPDVVADRTAMEQIMGNILTNAVLYLDRSRPGKIEIGGRRGPAETLFFVRDNGRGIAADDMPKVFAPFRRAGRKDVKGEGMGLAYVQALVRRHGGQIRCESKLGAGTTFTFTLQNPIEQGGRDAHAATT